MSDKPAGVTSRGERALLGGWIVAAALALAGTVYDTDPYWQIRAGQETLNGVPLARPDTWSWAPVDGLFYPNSPAWNVALAVAWGRLGSWGLYLVTVAVISVCLGLTVRLSLRMGARPVHVVVVLILTSMAVWPIMSPRPALAAETIFLLAVAFAEWWARRAARHRPVINASIAISAGLALSWSGNWVHLAWASLGLATVVAWAIIWLLTPAIRSASRSALIFAGTFGLVAGIALGPYGARVLERSGAVVAACRNVIVEWTTPFSTEFAGRWGVMAVTSVLAVAAALAWCLRSWRRSGTRDPRLPLGVALTVVSIPYAVAGTLYIRFIPVAMLSLAPLAAMALTAATDGAARWAATRTRMTGYVGRRLSEWTSDRYWTVILALVLVVLAPFIGVAGSRHAEPLTGEINDLLPRGCRMFGTSIEAASIILTRPDVTVWIDGRADYWGRERLLESHDYLYAIDQPTLVPPGTTCVVLAAAVSDPSLQPLTDALDADPAWSRVPGTNTANMWVPSAEALPQS